jgi:hypothetical protein
LAGNNLPVADYFKMYFQMVSPTTAAPQAVSTRAAYKEKIGDDVELTALYALLAPPPFERRGRSAPGVVHTAGRQSAELKSRRMPRFGTRVSVGYQWISGTTLTA